MNNSYLHSDTFSIKCNRIVAFNAEKTNYVLLSTHSFGVFLCDIIVTG